MEAIVQVAREDHLDELAVLVPARSIAADGPRGTRAQPHAHPRTAYPRQPPTPLAPTHAPARGPRSVGMGQAADGEYPRAEPQLFESSSPLC